MPVVFAGHTDKGRTDLDLVRREQTHRVAVIVRFRAHLRTVVVKVPVGRLRARLCLSLLLEITNAHLVLQDNGFHLLQLRDEFLDARVEGERRHRAGPGRRGRRGGVLLGAGQLLLNWRFVQDVRLLLGLLHFCLLSWLVTFFQRDLQVNRDEEITIRTAPRHKKASNSLTSLGSASSPPIHSSAVNTGTSPAVSGKMSSWNSSDYKKRHIQIISRHENSIH